MEECGRGRDGDARLLLSKDALSRNTSSHSDTTFKINQTLYVLANEKLLFLITFPCGGRPVNITEVPLRRSTKQNFRVATSLTCTKVVYISYSAKRNRVLFSSSLSSVYGKKTAHS